MKILRKSKGRWVAIGKAVTVLACGLALTSAPVFLTQQMVANESSVQAMEQASIFAGKDELINNEAVKQYIEETLKQAENANAEEKTLEDIKAEIKAQEDLKLPAYVVQPGDTLALLAEAVEKSAEDLAQENGFNDTAVELQAGDLLTGVLNQDKPDAAPSKKMNPSGAIIVTQVTKDSNNATGQTKDEGNKTEDQKSSDKNQKDNTDKPKVNEKAPEVIEEKPEVTEEKPEVTEEKPEVTEENPEVTEESPEVTEDEPEVTEEESEETEEEPEETEEEPEETEEEPEVTEEEPEVTEEEPEVTEEKPEVTEEEPEETEEEPEVTEETPEETTETPEVTEETPEVTEEEPEVTEETPEETTEAPEVTEETPEETTEAPEVTEETPEETTETPQLPEEEVEIRTLEDARRYINHNILHNEFLKLVNRERIKEGAEPIMFSNLIYNKMIAKRMAQLESNGSINFYDRDTGTKIAHIQGDFNGNTGKTAEDVNLNTLLKESEYLHPYGLFGENLAAQMGFYDFGFLNVTSKTINQYLAQEFFTMWMNSEGHRPQLMSNDYKYTAMGITFSDFMRTGMDTYDTEGRYVGAVLISGWNRLFKNVIEGEEEINGIMMYTVRDYDSNELLAYRPMDDSITDFVSGLDDHQSSVSPVSQEEPVDTSTIIEENSPEAIEDPVIIEEEPVIDDMYTEVLPAGDTDLVTDAVPVE